jgi:glutamate--cysteine ligase
VAGARQLSTSEDVHRYVATTCFPTGPAVTVGVELEWFVIAPSDPSRHVPLDAIRSVLDHAEPLPGGSRVSFEPGGQLELSSPAAPGVVACWKGVTADLEHVEAALAASGLALLGTGTDPVRRPRRQVFNPRYDTMEAYFDRRGPAGRVMMCGTAALQVNLDVGVDCADVARRWRLLHAIGPTLVAAFANSSRHAGRDTGWKSTRQAVWLRLDPPRTRPPEGANPVRAWTDYALDAPLMVRWLSDGRRRTDPGLTFRQWVESVDTRPTTEDLAYHLTTLFPPVRPRGWFEVRYLDAQSTAYWPVPLAVLSALVDDPAVGDRVEAAVEPVRDAWEEAARDGLASPALARAARVCFDAALDQLTTSNADPALISLVESYTDRYVARGRSPADDVRSSACAETTGSRRAWRSEATTKAGGDGEAAKTGIHREDPDERDRTAHVLRRAD